jgi:hypothetical protein
VPGGWDRRVVDAVAMTRVLPRLPSTDARQVRSGEMEFGDDIALTFVVVGMIARTPHDRRAPAPFNVDGG